MRKQFVDTFPLTALEEQALRDAEKAARERAEKRESLRGRKKPQKDN